MSWLNNDGLYIRFNKEQGEVGVAGEYPTNGQLREVHAVVELSELSSQPGILDQNLFYPDGVITEEVEVVTEVGASSTAGGSFNIGTIRLDQTTQSGADVDGFVDSMPATSVATAGTKLTLNTGTTRAGALLGAATANPTYLVGYYETAAIPTGKLNVRIKYYKPTA